MRAVPPPVRTLSAAPAIAPCIAVATIQTSERRLAPAYPPAATATPTVLRSRPVIAALAHSSITRQARHRRQGYRTPAANGWQRRECADALRAVALAFLEAHYRSM